MEKIVVESFYGFGDNLFIRPILIEQSKYSEVFVQTPYPELFLNTPVKPLRPGAFLYDFANRCLQDSSDSLYNPKPEKSKFLRPTYSVEDLKNNKTLSMSFAKNLSKKFDTRLKATDHQIGLGKELVNTTKPIMLVKIPSYRHDWECESRTPKTEYMMECMKIAKDRGLYIVSLQDFTLGDRLQDPHLQKEWEPLCDKLLHGKLSVDQLIGLFSISDCVLTYPNFLLPLAIYLDKPVFCIYGGSVRPQCIIDPRIDPKHYEYVSPDPFCHCVESHHDCNKEIPIFKVISKFINFLSKRYTDEDRFYWSQEDGYGYYPVNNEGVYDDIYFEKYLKYENTNTGELLNKIRVDLANRYCPSGKILDIGIGSGQFIKAVDGYGFDVCQKAIDYLKSNGRWIDFKKEGAYSFELVTFFDSFEHEDDIDSLVEACCSKPILMSIPIFKDKDHVLRSKHFRKDEHFHYFTRNGLIKYFDLRGYKCVYNDNPETKAGREDIETFVFEKKCLNE